MIASEAARAEHKQKTDHGLTHSLGAVDLLVYCQPQDMSTDAPVASCYDPSWNWRWAKGQK